MCSRAAARWLSFFFLSARLTAGSLSLSLAVLSCPVLSCAALCGAVLCCSVLQGTVKAQEEGRGEHKSIWTTGACPGCHCRGSSRWCSLGPEWPRHSCHVICQLRVLWLWLWISTAPRSSGAMPECPKSAATKVHEVSQLTKSLDPCRRRAAVLVSGSK